MLHSLYHQKKICHVFVCVVSSFLHTIHFPMSSEKYTQCFVCVFYTFVFPLLYVVWWYIHNTRRFLCHQNNICLHHFLLVYVHYSFPYAIRRIFSIVCLCLYTLLFPLFNAFVGEHT